MKTIQLINSDKEVLMSDEDYDFLSQHEWELREDGYAIRDGRREDRSRILFIHREVLGLMTGNRNVIHHVDSNRLNNCRENLQVMTRAEHQSFHNQGMKSYWHRQNKNGSANPNFKVTNEIKRSIIRDYTPLWKEKCEEIRRLTEKFRLGTSTIRKALKK